MIVFLYHPVGLSKDDVDVDAGLVRWSCDCRSLHAEDESGAGGHVRVPDCDCVRERGRVPYCDSVPYWYCVRGRARDCVRDREEFET